MPTLELDEEESEVVAVLVRRFARREREDVMGAILRNIPSGILDDKGVVALASKIESLPLRERLRELELRDANDEQREGRRERMP
jgi:hypothetical protein